jgi:hypothetical protein
MGDIAKTFERVVVINLARRAERLERFYAGLGDWPFARPERFEAADGASVSIPAAWQHGAGAWGCMLSHRRVLTDALREGVSSILVMEDDAAPVEGFAELVAEFLERVPSDWDGLMLGGQHLCAPQPTGPGVVRCQITNRCHAYALRGRLLPVVLSFWLGSEIDHCDIILASLMKHFKVYAPSQFLVGQDAGFSDITLKTERLRFLTGRSVVPKTVRIPAKREEAHAKTQSRRD